MVPDTLWKEYLRWWIHRPSKSNYAFIFDAETAIKVSDHILDGIERLGDFPDSGSRTPDDWLKEQGYRMAISGKYVSIYRVIKDIVYIYHIADTRTEYTKLFK